MRLYDSNFIEVSKPQQASLLNGRQDTLMNCRIDCRRGRMPYYPNWASHSLIINDFQTLDDVEMRAVLNL